MTRVFSFLALTIIIFLLLEMFISCNRGEIHNCAKYKNGRFEYWVPKPTGLVKFLIERNNNIQVETDTETGEYLKLRVKWIDDCTYETLLLETTMPISDSLQDIKKIIPLQTTIIDTSPEYYRYRSVRKGSGVMEDTIWIRQ